MRISVVIPNYITEENKGEILPLLSECVASLRGYDELILQFDMEGEGFAKTVNKGIKRTNGDYVAIVNNDTRMLNGSLKDMCHFNCIVRPKLIGGELAKFSFVVIERSIFTTVGFLDEDFPVGRYEDDDYLDRCKEVGVKLVDKEHIHVWHKGGATVEKILTPEIEEANRKLYENKRRARHQS